MNEELSEREVLIASWLRPQTRGLASPLTDLMCMGTRVGPQRKNNQDRVLCARFPDGYGSAADAFVLCDGIGGLENGAECAEYGISTFILVLASLAAGGMPLTMALRDATDFANRRVYNLYGQRGGTTLAAVVVHDHHAYVCSVGDTRVFAVGDDRLEQLTPDDTLKGALDALGQKGTEPSPEHRKLLQYIGMGPDVEPHISVFGDALAARFFLLCTDGAYRLPPTVPDLIAQHSATARQLVERLLASAEWLGVGDDSSAIAIAMPFLETAPHINARVMSNTLLLWGVGNSLMHMQLDLREVRELRRTRMHHGAQVSIGHDPSVAQHPLWSRAPSLARDPMSGFSAPGGPHTPSQVRDVASVSHYGKEIPNGDRQVKAVPSAQQPVKELPPDRPVVEVRGKNGTIEKATRSDGPRTKGGKKRRDRARRVDGAGGEVIIGPGPDDDDDHDDPNDATEEPRGSKRTGA